MKVKTSAVALFLTILMPCVSAQQPGGAALSAPRYDTGIVSDNVYTNSCMGLSLSIPAGWTVFKESGDTDTTKIATHMPGGTMTLLTIDRPTDPPSTNRIVVIARDGAGFNGTAQEFVARSIQGWVDRYPGRFELMRSPFLVEYGGKQFYRGDYKQNLPQIGVMYSAYIFTKFRGYLIGAMLTTRSTADLDQLANALQRLSFAEDRTEPTCVVGDNTLTGRMVGVIGSVSSSGEKPTRVRVSQNVAKVLLIKKVDPQFPNELREAGVRGPVVLQILISKEGNVEPSITAVSGDPKLVPAAMEAVKTWKYKPYTLNGTAVEVETTVSIPYPPQ